MRILTVAIAVCLANCLVYGEESEKGQSIGIEGNVKNSVKTKRGIHGFSSGLSYSIPTYGHAFTRYSRLPGIYKNIYALNPGNAVTHSFNVNYPKVFIPRPAIAPVLIPAKPILPAPPVPVYANRFPIFQPIVVHRVPQFAPPASTPHIHYNIPQPTLISQDGWRPIFSPAPISPQITTSGATQSPNNYYLPPHSSAHHDIGTHAAPLDHQQHDLHAHLQQLQHLQHYQNFLRTEQNEGSNILPISEQAIENASNNGRYTGPSSYDVHLNSRGRLQ